jgi:pyridoxamine 5'-phosphate oxidase
MRQLAEDPFEVFEQYFQKFQQVRPPEPTAMVLSTLGLDEFPNSRVVLLKGVDRKNEGFVFFSNYNSVKGQELQKTPRASLAFFWPEIQMQVRVQGSVEKVSREESEAYFSSRPRLSQIGAWASEQSQEIPDYTWLQQRVVEFEKKFEGQVVPCPEDWGGFLLKPKSFEFWFAHEGRLHERYCYDRSSSVAASSRKGWRRYMKSP